LKKAAISIGDLNGIGIQLALENHTAISKLVEPIYCIDKVMLQQAADKLDLSIPDDFQTLENISPTFEIKPGTVTKESGAYAYASFVKAVELVKNKETDAVCTLPIHKKAWELAGVNYKGHTDALRDFFNAEAIMMLGCPRMYVALFTEHIPLKEVPSRIREEDLTRFLIDFYHTAKPASTVAVLGLNPHAGDGGVLGDEEEIIQKAIDNANTTLRHLRKAQGTVTEPVEAYSNLPILRTSVDHGTAFDIAYKGEKVNGLSYLNAVRYIAER